MSQSTGAVGVDELLRDREARGLQVPAIAKVLLGVFGVTVTAWYGDAAMPGTSRSSACSGPRP